MIKNIKRKKIMRIKAYCFLLNICLVIIMQTVSVFAKNIKNDVIDNCNYETEDNDSKINKFFNDNYQNIILLAENTGLISGNVNDLVQKNSFTISDKNHIEDIWYYPIYKDNSVVFIAKVFYMDNNLYYTVSKEFVYFLNEIRYDGKGYFERREDEIYYIDENFVEKIVYYSEYNNDNYDDEFNAENESELKKNRYLSNNIKKVMLK